MEDNRFLEGKRLKKHELPLVLKWFSEQDYLANELFGFYSNEVDQLKSISTEAFEIFQKATDKIIRTNQLHQLNIPDFFHQAIADSWAKKKENPFLLGRFDLNGGIDHLQTRVIEFNADTFSSLPETLVWQPLQNKETQ
jgi:glutathionylspermidine synthase